jgi:hypothetical protein
MSSDEQEFTPEWGEDPDVLDPVNLTDNPQTLAMYHRLVHPDLLQPVLVDSEHDRPPSSPAHGTGDTTTTMLASQMDRLW